MKPNKYTRHNREKNYPMSNAFNIRGKSAVVLFVLFFASIVFGAALYDAGKVGVLGMTLIMFIPSLAFALAHHGYRLHTGDRRPRPVSTDWF